jgi:hypothetical protein
LVIAIVNGGTGLASRARNRPLAPALAAKRVMAEQPAGQRDAVASP